MELKVWVDGVVRVVCGVSPDTSCQDVVIALAQAIGQTGRYILILRLLGNETHLVADDCPMQRLTQLGQLAPEAQFILRRTGRSLSYEQNTATIDRHILLPRPSEPQAPKHRGPQKALTFNLGPTTLPRRTKPKRAWSPSPRASPEPQASLVSFLHAPNSVQAISSYTFKEEVFKQVLQQQRKLQDLEFQLQALERDTEVWEQEDLLSLTPSLTEELEELELQLRQNEAELMHRAHWEEQLKTEVDRQQDMDGRLHQIHLSVDDHINQMKKLQAHTAHLDQDIQLISQRQAATALQQQEEALRPLRQELHNRLQQGEELSTTMLETERELQATELTLQDRWHLIEDLNKELRQCNLQQFIQQTGGPNIDQTSSLPVTEVYLINAGIME